MNVVGLTNRTGSPASGRHLASSASAGACSNAGSPCRAASRSTTWNPTLCLVPIKREPGLPRPTSAFIPQTANPQPALLLLLFLRGRGRLGFFFLLALLDHFRFGRCCG